MHIITRMLEFDAGHRVYQHESKCNNIHGHRYKVELSVTAPDLDGLGRVIDFSVLKSICGTWIDDNLDHGMILFKDDPLCQIWGLFGQNLSTAVEVYPITNAVGDVGEQKHFIMDSNPTAENLAELMFDKFQELLLPHHIVVATIKVWETPNCFAIYAPS